MFPIIGKIGPLNLHVYGIIMAVVAVMAVLALGMMIRSGMKKREAFSAFLSWMIISAGLAFIPVLTSVTVYAYGLMMAVAVLLCSTLLVLDARKDKISSDIILDLVFWMVVGGIIGARLFYIILNYPYFLEHPEEIVMIQNGGLAWQGGLILGAFSGISFVRQKKLSVAKIVDLTAPYLALGQSIGRVGCFLNGCCYGKPSEWGVYFSLHDAYLHPTQLYLSIGYFIIFLILKKYQTFSRIPGLVFALFLILASVLRFLVEFFRADHQPLFLGLSIFQYVCIGILLAAFLSAYWTIITHSDPEDDL